MNRQLLEKEIQVTNKYEKVVQSHQETTIRHKVFLAIWLVKI